MFKAKKLFEERNIIDKDDPSIMGIDTGIGDSQSFMTAILTGGLITTLRPEVSRFNPIFIL